MSKFSHSGSEDPKSRHPQQMRGHERVAQLLQSGADVFAEKGFDAATMTEIAARAGASIGSLYQFFPNKDSLADTLHRANIEAIAGLLDALENSAPTHIAGMVADNILAQLSEFLLAHPEFATISERRNNGVQKLYVRDLMRTKISHLLQMASPPLSKKNADTFAVIILHLMKTLVAIHQEVELINREDAINSLRNMLRQSL